MLQVHSPLVCGLLWKHVWSLLNVRESKVRVVRLRVPNISLVLMELFRHLSHWVLCFQLLILRLLNLFWTDRWFEVIIDKFRIILLPLEKLLFILQFKLRPVSREFYLLPHVFISFWSKRFEIKINLVLFNSLRVSLLIHILYDFVDLGGKLINFLGHNWLELLPVLFDFDFIVNLLLFLF